MSTTAAGVIFIVSLVVALAVGVPAVRRLHVPGRHRRRGTRASSAASTGWSGSTRTPSRPGACTPAACWRSPRCRSCSCTLFQRLQDKLWLSPGLRRRCTDHVAWNTAVSFVTNTNWQAYSGESTMGHLVQMAGLAVQNFVSAAVGIAVAVALVRGFARPQDRPAGQLLGRPDPDHAADPAADRGASARSCSSPAGMVQNLSGGTDVTTLTGGTQHITGGPVASQEASRSWAPTAAASTTPTRAHPFENPTTWTNWLRDLPDPADPVQPAAGVRPDGRREPAGLRDRRRDGASSRSRQHRADQRASSSHGGGTVPQAVGAAMEGKEVRFGVPQLGDLRRGDHADLDRRGELVPRLLHRARRHDADGQHDARRGRARRRRLRPVRHAGPRGDHGVRGRADGRPHPGVPGQEDRRPGDQVRLAVLPGHPGAGADRHRRGDRHRQQRDRSSTSARTASPRCSTRSPRPATTTARRSPASPSTRRGGTPRWAWCMLLGRFLPIVLVLGLAGSLARQTAGARRRRARCRPTSRCSSAWSSASPSILVALTFLPALALGPLAEGLSGRTDIHDMSSPPSAPPPRRPADRGGSAAACSTRQQLWQLAAGRAAQARTRATLWRNPVMFIVEIGAVVHHRAGDRRPERVRLGRSRSGCG